LNLELRPGPHYQNPDREHRAACIRNGSPSSAAPRMILPRGTLRHCAYCVLPAMRPSAVRLGERTAAARA
jgi:hypothetical protein